MADVLMNKVDLEVIDPFQPGLDVISHLRLHYRDKFKIRKRAEQAFWEDPDEDFIQKLKLNDEGFNVYFK